MLYKHLDSLSIVGVYRIGLGSVGEKMLDLRLQI